MRHMASRFWVPTRALRRCRPKPWFPALMRACVCSFWGHCHYCGSMCEDIWAPMHTGLLGAEKSPGYMVFMRPVPTVDVWAESVVLRVECSYKLIVFYWLLSTVAQALVNCWLHMLYMCLEFSRKFNSRISASSGASILWSGSPWQKNLSPVVFFPFERNVT